jgi:hypothetical protein|tara:strand:- start:1565 stop:1831 length:267 start_codon:yes stop_codon:yes gene_type:complete
MPSRSIVSARSRVAASSSEVSAAPSDEAGARVERPRVVERRARRAGVRAKSVGRASSARARVDISLDEDAWKCGRGVFQSRDDEEEEK